MKYILVIMLLKAGQPAVIFSPDVQFRDVLACEAAATQSQVFQVHNADDRPIQMVRSFCARDRSYPRELVKGKQ